MNKWNEKIVIFNNIDFLQTKKKKILIETHIIITKSILLDLTFHKNKTKQSII